MFVSIFNIILITYYDAMDISGTLRHHRESINEKNGVTAFKSNVHKEPLNTLSVCPYPRLPFVMFRLCEWLVSRLKHIVTSHPVINLNCKMSVISNITAIAEAAFTLGRCALQS